IISCVWLVGEQETKQWVHARLQTVPPTWNQRVSRARSSTRGAACVWVFSIRGALMSGSGAGARGLQAYTKPRSSGDGFSSFRESLRYDRPPLRRFLIFSIPLLILAMALFHFALEALGRAPDPTVLSPADGRDLPGWVALATWGLEALSLSALFLLVYSRNGLRWLSGLLTGWIAWVFRGPLLVVTVVGLAG